MSNVSKQAVKRETECRVQLSNDDFRTRIRSGECNRRIEIEDRIGDDNLIVDISQLDSLIEILHAVKAEVQVEGTVQNETIHD